MPAYPQPPEVANWARCEIRVVDPATIATWDTDARRFEGYLCFTGRNWCETLHSCYGYRPLYLQALAGTRVVGILPLMEVKSALTGKRGVSLPFSDECGPLAFDPVIASELSETARRIGQARGWRYLEVRGPGAPAASLPASATFARHTLVLDMPCDRLYSSLAQNTRRSIRKSERVGVTVTSSTRSEDMEAFYRLQCRTRRRHGLPSQPAAFFDRVQRLLVESGEGVWFLARLSGRPIAGALYLLCGRDVLFKFGASDERFFFCGANASLMWTAIARFAQDGFRKLHLGRSAVWNSGLRRFKASFAAREDLLSYARFDYRANEYVTAKDHARSPLTPLFRMLPIPVLRLIGHLLYRHIA